MSLPDHRPRGRIEDLDERDMNHPAVGMMYLADLLRGKPGPRGHEFWRLGAKIAKRYRNLLKS